MPKQLMNVKKLNQAAEELLRNSHVFEKQFQMILSQSKIKRRGAESPSGSHRDSCDVHNFKSRLTNSRRRLSIIASRRGSIDSLERKKKQDMLSLSPKNKNSPSLIKI